MMKILLTLLCIFAITSADSKEEETVKKVGCGNHSSTATQETTASPSVNVEKKQAKISSTSKASTTKATKKTKKTKRTKTTPKI